MILVIDTSDQITKISLLNSDLSIISERECKLDGMLSESLLTHVDNILEDAGMSKDGIKKILVNHGPGSYTGLRIGVTAANFLGYALNIPVSGFDAKHPIRGKKSKQNEKKFAGAVIPKYQKPPHITKPSIVL